MTCEEALNYLNNAEWKSDHAGLRRMEELCRRLGHPERDLRFIHVAGTNGKGSVCAMLDSVLRSAGYRVGLFTSPYIERFNERIRLDGAEISDEELAAVTEAVKACADDMAEKPTAFERITAAALVYYSRMACDVVVWECGLGGRLDATNVIPTAELSVITGIALDHCHILGDTMEQIAAEKAGIIKPSVPVLFGQGDESAAVVIRAAAEERRSPLYLTDFSAISDVRADLSGTVFRFRGRELRMALVGLYQTRNAATALTAVELLRQAGLAISEAAVTDGLASARWRARFEVLARDPLTVYDGAHNPQGVDGAVENIASLLSPLTPDGRVILLTGVIAEKDHRRMMAALAPYAAAAVTVRPDSPRALAAEDTATELRDHGVPVRAAGSVADGVRAAVTLARREKRPLVCLGSLYLYAPVRQALYALLGE